MTIERLLEAGRALEAGRLEQAERIYRQVAEADPRSSIAIVGLARLARRRGDEVAAAQLARSALAVDPGNVAAQRLLGEQNAGRQATIGDPGSGPVAASASWPPDGAETPGEDWPWPDLDEQLARYRAPRPGRLGRLLKRG